MEDLQRVKACLPTGPELKTVEAYDGPVEDLGAAEAFFRAMASTRRPGFKVTAMLFSLQFPSIAEVCDTRLETLSRACEEAMNSDRLARLLDRVLYIGNLLNEGETFIRSFVFPCSTVDGCFFLFFFSVDRGIV